ncbi:MAG: transposase [Nitrospirae bacterium]|nr:transposase [Nitrospirota bacterium]
MRPRASLAAENLFLRKQLALFRERKVRPRRADGATRLGLVLLSRLFDWKDALVAVKPGTLIRWHRLGFRMLWRRKCLGRPRLPRDLRNLVAAMARDNPTWGEERIAAELSVKLGIRVSARTVRKYMPRDWQGRPRQTVDSLRWGSFVRNHAKAIIACDFLVSVTASFRTLYVLVVIEVESRRIVHCGVTSNPTAGWTTQRLREAIPWEHPYRFLIHDRDSIFSEALDRSVANMGIRVLKTPVRAPKANAFCERVIGTVRRECLDFLIPLGENHLSVILKEWVGHYNRGRPHSSLGPGIPEPPEGLPAKPQPHRHRIPKDARIGVKPILGGLHHEYRLEKLAA